MFLIGSRAAAYYGLNLKRDVNLSDWDIIGNKTEMNLLVKTMKADARESKFPGKYHIIKGKTKIEFDATDNKSNKLLYGYLNESKVTHMDIGGSNMLLFIPPKEILFQIKRSHANFVHTGKSLADLLRMIDSWGMTLPVDNAFYRQRFAEAKERFGEIQKRIKLDKSNDEFFKGGMNLRTYVHDDLHVAVSYYGTPMFEKAKKDLDSAMISKELFYRLPVDDRLKMAMEEAMVIGLERFYIPRMAELDQKMSPFMAKNIYMRGLVKEIADLSKGWFQDFMIDHIKELSEPKWDYIKQFKESLNSGKIRHVV